MKTGPGVTAGTISIGMMTDLTGPYASFGKSLTNAQQLYFEQVNAAGGVCGRKLEAVVRDHGYDVQKAVAAYTEIGPKVVAMAHVVGSPMVNAVKQRIEADKMLTIPQAWATSLLGSEPIQVTATTYDIDMINAVDFLAKEKGVKSGDKIGHLYFEGDYGERPQRLEVRRREARPGAGGAEDQGDRPGHDRAGRRVQEGGRQGRAGLGRPPSDRLPRRRLAGGGMDIRSSAATRPTPAAAAHAGRSRPAEGLLLHDRRR
nr:hypothetical protein GCM10020093_000350 [Planobispora longispora]